MTYQRNRFFAIICIILFIGTGIPSMAWGFFVQAEGEARVRGGNVDFITDSEDTGQIEAANVTMNNIFLSDSNGASTAWADVRAQASLGRLRVYAEYYAYREGWTPGSVGVADSTARWQDTVTVTSAVLPIGTEVILRASVTLTGSLTEVIDGNAIGNGFIRNVVSGGSGYGSYYFHIEENENDPGVRTMTDTFNARVGDTFDISGYLRGYVGGDAIDGGSSHLTADFFSTSDFTLDMLTAGAGYITESGVSYATIPLPGSALLLFLALLSLCAAGRRKSSWHQ